MPPNPIKPVIDGIYMYAEPVGALLDVKARVREFSYSAGQFAVVIVPRRFDFWCWSSSIIRRATWAARGVRTSPQRLESQIAPLSGAGLQPAFMCTRAQSAKFVNPPGTRALAAAMYRSRSGPK